MKEYIPITKPHGGAARTGRAMDYKNQSADRLAMLMDMAMQRAYAPRFVPVVTGQKPLSMVEKLQAIDSEIKKQLEKYKDLICE